jgi:hypothetical protein
MKSHPHSSKVLGILAGLLLADVARTEENLSGTYAYLLETQTTTKLPVVKDYVATTRSIALLQLTQKEGRLTGSGRVCSLRMTGSSSIVKTLIPPAFLKALPPVVLNAELLGNGPELELQQRAQTLVVGANLRHPLTDPLPEEAEDPRVIDPDHDKKPGMTIRVEGLVSGDVYVVQRSTSSLSGTQTPNGFAGKVSFKTEQRVLGASSPFLKGNRAADPNPDKSYFVLQKLSARATCAEAESRVAPIHSLVRTPKSK